MSKTIEFDRAGMAWAAEVTIDEQYRVQCNLISALEGAWFEQFGKSAPTKDLVIEKVYTVTYEW